MLNIHKPNHKLLILGITSICGIGALLGFSVLTYTPELSHAETVIYPEKETRTMDDITYMQDITPEICQNSELNKQYTLTDKRDDNTYTVARIKNQADEKTNCWMTQNLRIINKEISYLDSDMEEGSFTIPASNTSGFSSTHIYERKAYFSSEYGGYYNWYTATAGGGDNSFIEGDAPHSICPKGWRLPRGGDRSEITSFLGGIDEVYMLLREPYFFSRSGRMVSGSGGLINADDGGFYWSSTVKSSDSSFAHILYFYNNTIRLNTSDRRYHGESVRCVVKSTNRVEITVNPTISLDVAEEVVIEKGENNPSTVDLKVKVSSNQPYVVKLSSDDAVMRSRTTNVIIPAKSGLLNTAENGWGIMKYNANTYTAITSTPELFYEAASPEVKELLLEVGISTVPDLPSGEYSTNITVTATQN